MYIQAATAKKVKESSFPHFFAVVSCISYYVYKNLVLQWHKKGDIDK